MSLFPTDCGNAHFKYPYPYCRALGGLFLIFNVYPLDFKNNRICAAIASMILQAGIYTHKRMTFSISLKALALVNRRYWRILVFVSIHYCYFFRKSLNSFNSLFLSSERLLYSILWIAPSNVYKCTRHTFGYFCFNLRNAFLHLLLSVSRKI